MNVFLWIVGSGVLMTAISGIGSISYLVGKRAVKKLLLPLVAFSAGTLLGGAFFHMIPASLGKVTPPHFFFLMVLLGFAIFLALEQFLHWHHCHRAEAECREPFTYLLLIGDGIHHLIGGIAVASAFMVDIRLGIMTWIAAAAHEIPKELGDFSVMLQGGYSRGRAILYNVYSGGTFLIGGLLTFAAAYQIDTVFLVPFAAGNFIYIAASDLVPQVNRHEDLKNNLVHFGFFIIGLLLMLGIRIAAH